MYNYSSDNLIAARPDDISIFKGIAGRRQAFKLFLVEISKATMQENLLITSSSDLLWLSQDNTFLEASRDYFINCLEKVKKATVLHSFDRSVSNLVYIINYWVPIYLSGKVEGGVLNNYKPNQPKITMFLIENRVCVFSIESDSIEDSVTFFFRQKEIVCSYQKVFYLMKQNSIPINKVSGFTNYDYFMELINLKKLPGSYSACFNAMTALMLPPSIYEKVLDSLNLTKAVQKKRLSSYTAAFKELARNITKFAHNVVIFTDLINTLSGDEKVRYCGIEFFEDGYVFVDKQLCLEHLQFLYNTMKASRLEVIFIKTHEYARLSDFNFVLKENGNSITYRYNPVRQSYDFFLSGSQLIIDTYTMLHKNIIDSVPADMRDSDELLTQIFQEDSKRAKELQEPHIFSVLTKKEKSIVKMLLEGMTVRTISYNEKISENTVKTHIRNIYHKLEINSKYELIRLASDSIIV